MITAPETTTTEDGAWREFVAMLCDESIGVDSRAEALSRVPTSQVTGPMLAEMASFLLEQAVPLNVKGVDVCGTGGAKGKTGIKTFNVSTASAFVLAAGGVSVTKHGNRAVTSKAGSSDVLAALSVPICTTAEQAQDLHKTYGLCFIAAPAFHPVLARVALVRKMLGQPTFFNLLGPLCNPARPVRQIIGTFDPDSMRALAEAAHILGKTDLMVVHGHDGLDEISLCTPTRVVYLKDGTIYENAISPADLGLRTALPADIAGGDATENAEIIRRIFTGQAGAPMDMICANAAAGFVLSGKVETLREGVDYARATLIEGKAMAKLEETRSRG